MLACLKAVHEVVRTNSTIDRILLDRYLCVTLYMQAIARLRLLKDLVGANILPVVALQSVADSLCARGLNRSSTRQSFRYNAKQVGGDVSAWPASDVRCVAESTADTWPPVLRSTRPHGFIPLKTIYTYTTSLTDHAWYTLFQCSLQQASPPDELQATSTADPLLPETLLKLLCLISITCCTCRMATPSLSTCKCRLPSQHI